MAHSRTTKKGNKNFIEIGQDVNILSFRKPDNIAILELSTKAVKLLIGDISRLRNGFDFSCFRNFSDLTNTGDCLDSSGNMDLSKFRQHVLPSIISMRDKCLDEEITKLYCVATAAYRNANNVQDILDILKQEANLEVKVISPNTEANFSLAAFLWSSPKIVSSFKQDIIMFDQGGGSVQVYWFEHGDGEYNLNVNHNFSLGTNTLKRMLCSMESTLPLEVALRELDEAVEKEIGPYFHKIADDFMDDAPKSCFSMGAAITRATGKTSNRKQHLTKLNVAQLKQIITQSEQQLLSEYTTVSSVKPSLELEQGNLQTHPLEQILVMRLGLPMYTFLMQVWNIPEIVVSGTALRYGIYWKKLQELRLQK